MCYNMCTQRSPHNWSEQLYVRHKEVSVLYPIDDITSSVYCNGGQAITDYLESTVLVALEPRRDEALLKELARRWANHGIMNLWMKNFFQYLVRPCDSDW